MNQPTTTDVTLELVHVRKVFRPDVFKKKYVAIDDLSCAFPKGQCTGLLGHNGAGKTTTIRMILSLIRPDSGKIHFEGKALKTSDKRVIGYMPEVAKLPGGLTPEEILQHQLQLFAPDRLKTRAERRQAVEHKLAEVGLTEHRKKRVGKLSKGLGRRLAWAQATIHSPRLLILDEPSSGLDPLGRKHMLGWIAEEKRRGTTILLCTHELQQISTLCDGMHVLRQGKLVYTTAGGSVDGKQTARQRMRVEVSGLDEKAQLQLALSLNLAAPLHFRQEGYLGVLSFDDYGLAAAWMAALLAHGYVIVRFGDEGFLGEDELLGYFEGER